MAKHSIQTDQLVKPQLFDEKERVRRRIALWLVSLAIGSLLTVIVVANIVNSSDSKPTPIAPVAAAASPGCTQAFEAMRVGYDKLYAQGDYTDEQANALEVPPLNACSTAEEWIAAGKANPAALGLWDADAVDMTSLEIRCGVHPATAACTN